MQTLPPNMTVAELIEELKRHDPTCRVRVVKSWTFNKSHKISRNWIVETHQADDEVILEIVGR